jgi:hypothetical protein
MSFYFLFVSWAIAFHTVVTNWIISKVALATVWLHETFLAITIHFAVRSCTKYNHESDLYELCATTMNKTMFHQLFTCYTKAQATTQHNTGSSRKSRSILSEWRTAVCRRLSRLTLRDAPSTTTVHVHTNLHAWLHLEAGALRWQHMRLWTWELELANGKSWQWL